MGFDSSGEIEYKKYPYKMVSGNILPKGVIVYLKKRKINACFYKGTIKTLKKRISLGNPVIVFIKVFPRKQYLHYVPVIGYDETYFYLAESLVILKNSDDEKYSRQISTNDLKRIWNTRIPLYKNTYIAIDT
jgi:hypothetical protein